MGVKNKKIIGAREEEGRKNIKVNLIVRLRPGVYLIDGGPQGASVSRNSQRTECFLIFLTCFLVPVIARHVNGNSLLRRFILFFFPPGFFFFEIAKLFIFFQHD